MRRAIAITVCLLTIAAIGCADRGPSVVVIEPTYSLYRDGPPPAQVTGQVLPIVARDERGERVNSP